MLWLYRILFLPALLLLSPYYLARMKRRGGYRGGFANRFGRYRGLAPKAPGRPRIWVQAVSVGEMLAIAPILEALHRDGCEIFLTTTTSTGFRLAQSRYGALIGGLGYFPLDAWPFARAAWKAIDPDLAVVTEGERWPEHGRQARRRGVRVVCVNARISERSFERLRPFPFAARFLLGSASRLLPCSAEDRSRFARLGVPDEAMTVTGNIKFDLEIPRLGPAEADALRRELGLGAGPILLGSSTWPGEEEALLRALAEIRAAGLRCSLLLVPRHAERREEIVRLLQGGPWRFHLRSRGAAAEEADVAVADTTGELRRLTQLADLVFVGKSLPPHTEGQTPVEAAALGRPILFGPGMANFRGPARELLAEGAAREVGSAGELAGQAAALLRDPAARASMAAAAAAWRERNRGAAARTLAILREELARPRPALPPGSRPRPLPSWGTSG